MTLAQLMVLVRGRRRANDPDAAEPEEFSTDEIVAMAGMSFG